MARKAETTRELPEADSWTAISKEYVHLSNEAKALKKKQDALKIKVVSYIVENGEEDDDGHIRMELPQPFEGISALRRERAVSRGSDTEAQERILTEAGLLDRCMPPKPTLDEDAVMAARYEGLLTDEQLFEMFPEKIVYRLVPKK